MALFEFNRPAAKTGQPPSAAVPGRPGLVPIGDLLRLAVDENASDLHLSVGMPPVLRVSGGLRRLQATPLSPQDVEFYAGEIASELQMMRVRDEGTIDFAFNAFGHHRFRASIFREKGRLAVALRVFPEKLWTLEQIGAPLAVHNALVLPRGLVLITGPTGSGKSSTLAAMISVINRQQSHHVITIEDPVEYVHDSDRSVVHQREVGSDVPSFAEGLRRALRQDPDVILVGEMRDLETIRTAITAAETGHLVLSTLHTTGAARTVDRIIDSFPAQEQEQVRVQLASNLKAVVSQLLIPTVDGKQRVAAFEVMVNTEAIAVLIREQKSFRIASEIQTGARHGMMTLDASLVDLYANGRISLEAVRQWCQDPQLVEQLLSSNSGARRR
jgi:twitching motility protein PilT